MYLHMHCVLKDTEIHSTSLQDVKYLLRFAQFKRRTAVRMPARKMLKAVLKRVKVMMLTSV